MKVQISEMCSGHGRCYVLHGEVYESDDNGYALHRGGEFEVPEGLEAIARKGVSVCPERAISIVEE
ncbi:MAG TPA: ferredoxin [Solirubrobacteraceae bacterium]|jgi:ferredoxin|nr:ferredoxin [Solirubrobacteraceae bacterium]